MARLNFISNDVRNSVILKINNAKFSLESAKAKARSLDVPNFSYSGYLDNLSDMINNNIMICNTDEEWLEDSVKNFQTFNDESIDLINKCEVREIPEKDFHVNLIKE